MSCGRVAVVAALSCGLAACAYLNTLQNGAARTFSADYTCPRERMVLTRQPMPHAPAKPPPDEVARDPDRLALWNKQAANEAKTRDDWVRYAIQGCGHDAVYDCSWSTNPDGTSAVGCARVSP
jgi:hypothetical protein